jgi:hypothetical protein
MIVMPFLANYGVILMTASADDRVVIVVAASDHGVIVTARSANDGAVLVAARGIRRSAFAHRAVSRTCTC